MAATDIRTRLARCFRRHAELCSGFSPDGQPEALEELAQYVEALPDNEPRLLVLDGFDQSDLEIYSPWKQARALTEGFRLNTPGESCDGFLSRFTDLEMRDLAEVFGDGDLDDEKGKRNG